MDDDYEQGSADAAHESAARMRTVGQTISTWIGASLAMVLLLGLGTWFYHLGVRDAQQVPIIRASSEPVKTRPVEKGGEVTPHQDIASYDAGSVDFAPEPKPKLAPAPPKPAAEDVAMADLPKPVVTNPIVPKPAVPQVLAQNPDSDVIEAPTAGVMTIMPEGEPEPQPRPQPALAEAGLAETIPAPEVAAVETVEAPLLPTSKPTPSEQQEVQEAVETVVAELAVEPEVVPLTPQGRLSQPASTGNEFAPDYSPRVIKRPPDLKQKALESRAKSAENDAAAADQLALQAQQSKIKVQLQASPSRDDIISSWNNIRKKHADIVGQKSLAVQLTKSGGVTFYRLRLGPFRDRTEAKAVCTALKARNQDCIVTSDG